MDRQPGRFTSIKKILKKQFLTLLPETVLMPLRKVHYSRVLAGVSEGFTPDFSVLKALVSSGDIVVDLGAHIGIYTKYLSDLVGPAGQVLSVEPFPSNFNILSSNVKKLKLSNVRLINCAVSDAAGRLTMEIPRFSEFGESFYDARVVSAVSNPALRQAEVTVKTVDGLFGELPAVSFVKCDVEGHELQTLHGARNLIERHKPAWLIEISLMDPVTHEKIRELLAKQDYGEFWFTGVELKCWEQGDKPVDAFFLQPRQVARAKQFGL